MAGEIRIGYPSEVQLVLDQREFGVDGELEGYRVRLLAEGLLAERPVYHQTFAMSLSEFFETLSRDWRGWKGNREWHAPEGEYRLSASMNRLGHVTLSTQLIYLNFIWEATAEVRLDAGQLDSVTTQIRKFFDGA